MFPTGIPQAPPPPPPLVNAPPPPPLPELPVKGMSDGSVRPDMTKIIPENPMALLRKSPGPPVRKSFVEEMEAPRQSMNAPQSPPMRQTPQR